MLNFVATVKAQLGTRDIAVTATEYAHATINELFNLKNKQQKSLCCKNVIYAF